MTTACHVCRHPARHLIEIALVHKLPVRVIARRFGLSKSSVFAHRRNHLSPQLVAAILTAQHPSAVDLEALEKSESAGLLASLISQRARLQLLSSLAFEAGEIAAATTVERAITASLELTSKLLGMIVQRHHTTSTSVLLTGDYLALRSAIVRALKPYPEAARAVGAALHELEVRASRDFEKAAQPLLEAQPC